MSLRRTLAAAVAAFTGIASLASAAHAGPWNLAPGEYYSQLSGGFFSANSFYDDTNTRLELGGLAEQRTISSWNELGWTKHMNFLLGLPVVSETVRDQSGPTLTNSGIGDVTLGMRYGLHSGATASAIQVTWEAPTGLSAQLSPLVTDGLQKLEADLFLGGALGSRAFLQLGAGYRYDYMSIGARSTSAADGAAARNWSDHTVAQAALGVWLGGNLQLAGLYRGEFAGATGRGTYTFSGPLDVNGTLHEFRVDRQMAGPLVTYRLDDKLDAFVGSWHTPTGRNTLHVDQFYMGFAWKMTKLNRLQGFLGGAKRP